MVIYREHKGGLAESMETAREFNDFAEMKAYIVKQNEDYYKSLGYGVAPFDADDIVIDEGRKADDSRTGWHDTMHVCVKRYGNEDYMKLYGAPQCIGMCATNYDK